MHRLVICFGNLARGDDGVARRVASLLEERLPVDVRLVSLPQLDVALAEDVASASRVLFVDAERREQPPVSVAELKPDISSLDVHFVSPAALVALATQLYGSRVSATLVSVAAPLMEHGEGLSATAEAASLEAASVVLDLLREAD